MAQGRIKLGVDIVKGNTSGLVHIQNELRKITNLANAQLKVETGDAQAELQALSSEAQQLSNIFSQSYNFKLNSVDFNKLRQNLKEANFDLASFSSRAKGLGTDATLAVDKLNAALYRTQTQLKENASWVKKMSDTLANTVRWTAASTALNAVSGSIQKAWGFTKQLDKSLNDIRIVTGKNADEMERFARQANRAAQTLGASTRDYANAALIYYQQGLSESDVQARASTTVKAANVTGQDARAVSEQLTAVWNGYKVSAQEAELYIDKLSAVAARTAADLEELSTGMSRVASAASIMGVDIDQLNAQMATIVSVTREAPESIGTALKTVYARMSDIESGLDTETTLGEYTAQMAEMGINVLNAKGNLRDMGDVVEEIGDKWNTLNRNQQTALAQIIAGTRQYSRMMALFDNWDMYQSSKAISQSSAGALQKQQDTYLDSLEAKIEKLNTATEQLYISLVDNEGIKSLIDGLTTAVELAGEFVDIFGGGLPLLLSIGGIFTSKIGGNMLGDLTGSGLTNLANKAENRKQIKAMDAEIAEEEADFANPAQAAEKWRTKIISSQEELDAANSEIEINVAELAAQQEQLTKLEAELVEARKSSDTERVKTLEAEQRATQLRIDTLKQERNILNSEQSSAQRKHENAIANAAFYEKGATEGFSEEDRQVLEHRRHERNVRKRLTPEQAQERDQRNDERIAANEAIIAANQEIERIEKEKVKKLAALQEEELENNREFQRELKKELEKVAVIREEAAAKEALDVAKEKLATEESSQQAALETFKKYARRADGERYSDKTQFTYREGADAGGGYIDPATAAQTMATLQGEFGIHEAGINKLASDLTSGRIDATSEETIRTLEEEYKWLEAHREQIDLTEREWREVEEAYEKYQQALTGAKAAPDNPAAQEKARVAALGLTGGKGKQGVVSNKLQKAQASLGSAVKSLEGQNVDNYRRALEERERLEIEYNEASERAAEERTTTQNRLIEKQTKVVTENANKQYDEQQKIINENKELTNQLNMADWAQENQVAFQKMGQSIGQVTGGIMQMAGAIAALTQLPKIWSDEDASTGEKVVQTLMIGIPAVFSLGTGLFTVAGGLNTITTTAPGVIASLFGIKIGADSATTGVVSLTAAIATLFSVVLLPALAIGAAIAAIVAGIAIAVDLLSKAYNKDAIAAEKAAERAEELAEAFKEAKARYEELKNSIEDYRTTQNAIDRLVVGTEEWRDAIAEANLQILELMRNYPELTNYISNVGGRLTISDEGFDELLDKERARTTAAYRANVYGQQSNTEAQFKAQTTQLAQDIEYVAAEKIVGTVVGTVAALLTAGGVGLVYEGIGYLIQSLSTGDWGAWFENEMDPDVMADVVALAAKEGNEGILTSVDSLRTALQNSENQSLQELASSERMLKTLVDNRSSIENLVATMRENNIELQALRQQLVISELSNNQTYLKLQEERAELEQSQPIREEYDSIEDYIAAINEYQNKINAIDTRMNAMTSYFAGDSVRSQRQQQIEDEVLTSSQGKHTAVRYLPVADKERLVKEYWANQLGIPESDIEVRTKSDKGWGDYDIIYTANGETHREDDLTFDDLQTKIIDKRLSETEWSEADVKEFEERFATQFNDLEEKAYQSFIGTTKGNFSSLTQKEVDELISTWANLDWESIKANPKELEKIKRYAEALGHDTTDSALKALVEGIQDGFKNYQAQEEKINHLFLGQDISTIFTTQEAQNALANSNQATKQQFATLWNDLAKYTVGGEETATQLASALTEENIGLVAQALKNVKWADQNSVAEFTELLTDLGFGDISQNFLAEFTYQMRFLNNAIEEFDLQKAEQGFINLSNVIDAINSDEKRISADEYSSLSDEMQEYFLRMADGTYELIKTSKEFQQEAKKARQEELRRQATEAIRSKKETFTLATTINDAEEYELQQQANEANAAIDNDIKAVKNAWNNILPIIFSNSSQAEADLNVVLDKYFSQEDSGIDAKGILSGDWDAYVDIGKIQASSLWHDVTNPVDTTKAYLAAQKEWLTNPTKENWLKLTSTGNLMQTAAEDMASNIQKARDDNSIETKREEFLNEKREKAGIADGQTAPDLVDANFQALLSQMFAEAGSLSDLNSIWEDIQTSEDFAFDEWSDDERQRVQAKYDLYRQRLEEAVTNFKVDIDPFEELNKELDKSVKKLEHLGELSDLVTGAAYLENLKAQNAELDKQVKLSQKALESGVFDKYLDDAKQDLQEVFENADWDSTDALDISSMFDKFIFDPDSSEILNYREVLSETEELLRTQGRNDLNEAFNENIQNALSTYEERLTQKANVITQLEANQLQQLANNVELIEVTLNTKLDKEELKRDFASFVKELNTQTGVSLELFNVESYLHDMNNYIDSLATIQNLETILTDEEWQQLSIEERQQAINEGAISQAEKERLLQENATGLMTSVTASLESQVTAMEELNQLYETQLGFLETAAGFLENQLNAEELLSGTASSRAKILQDQAAIQTLSFKSTLANFQTIAEQYNENASDAIKAKYFELAEQVGNSYISTIETIQEAYKAGLKETIESTLGVTEDSLNGYLAEQEWWNKGAKYLDTIDRTYQENRLARSFKTAIGEASDARAQQRLNDVYKQQLEILRTKDDLTQADFERAEKTLELEKARLALEQARESKTQMRLMRNKDGSYSYQYVVNQSKIEEARQQVEDLENELVNIDEAAVKENLNSVAELYSTFIETVSEMMVNGFTIEEEAQLTAMIDFLKKELGEGDDLLRNWASSLGISFEDLMQWNSADFAAHGLSEGLFKLWQSLSSGDWEKVFEIISTSGEDALQTIANALGRSPKEISELLAVAGNNAVDEAESMETAIMRESAAWKELGDIIGRDASAFNALTKSIMQTVAAASGATMLLNGESFTAESLSGPISELLNVINTVPGQIATAKTGGYTGAWGAEGRFILAHEKELILNQTDTRNILAAVDIVRSLGDSMLKTVFEMGRGYDLPMAAWELAKELVIEQTVHINAEFPHATDKSEIEAAFEELMLLATQHAFDSTKD